MANEVEGISDIKDMICLVFEPKDSHTEILHWAWCELYDKMVPRSKMREVLRKKNL